MPDQHLTKIGWFFFLVEVFLTLEESQGNGGR